MKRAMILVFSLILALSLLACGAEEVRETTLPAPRETVQYGPAPTDSAPTQAPSEAPGEPEVAVEVKDVFVDKAVMLDYDQTYYFHIPSIHIAGVNTDEVNQQMYYELYSFINQYVYENPDYPYLGDMGYLWAVNHGIVSVITEVVVGPDSSPNPMYIIYNVDLATGQRVEDEAVVKAFGLESASYREQVRNALEQTYLGMYQTYYEENQNDEYLAELYRQQYENTVADANVSNALPYIDVSGQLCVVADIYSLAGGDSYRHLVGLSADLEPAYPKAEPFE